MVLSSCIFETERLLVREWHALLPTDWELQQLARLVADMLTEPVTRPLPATWQGSYTIERAKEWIQERDKEGSTLLIVNKVSKQPVGLMILFELQAEGDDGGVDIRLGYLLSEDSWGKGFATEMVSGFVGWSRRNPAIRSISGGVAVDNPASSRVLEKNGFYLVEGDGHVGQDEQFYQIKLG